MNEACEERFALCFLFFENLIELLVTTCGHFPIPWTGEGKLVLVKKKDGASSARGGFRWWTRVKRERKPREERENRDRYIIPPRARERHRDTNTLERARTRGESERAFVCSRG